MKSNDWRRMNKKELMKKESVCVHVCAHFCAGGSVVKLQEIRKLSPDQRLREKRADTVSPSAQFTSRAGKTCCTGQSLEHWQRCFIFTCLFWELDGGKFDMTRLAQHFDMAACLKSNRERSNWIKRSVTQIRHRPVRGVTGDSSSACFSNYLVQNKHWEGVAGIGLSRTVRMIDVSDVKIN